MAKLLEFLLSISPSNEYSGFIFFRMDWLDLLAVQGTLKSLLQHHSSKASVLQHSALFRPQLSHLYMTTGKIIALIRQTFVSKVMSLVFNMLSRFVIAFLPRRKCLLTLILIWLTKNIIMISHKHLSSCLDTALKKQKNFSLWWELKFYSLNTFHL